MEERNEGRGEKGETGRASTGMVSIIRVTGATVTTDKVRETDEVLTEMVLTLVSLVNPQLADLEI